MITQFKLFEDPDTSYYIVNGKEKYTRVSDKDAYAYIYHIYENKIYLSKVPGLYHDDLIIDYDNETGIDIDIKDSIRGRLWFDRKIISFWRQIPDMEKFLKTLEKAMKKNKLLAKNETIFTNDWQIEISDRKFVPTIDFSNDIQIKTDDEKYQLHLLNAKEKAKRLKEIGYKPKIKQWKEWQKPFESKIYESPDQIEYNGKILKVNDKDSISFATDYENKNIILSDKGESHSNMADNWKKYGEYKFRTSGLAHTSGRIWLDSKIISFWDIDGENNGANYKEKLEEIERLLKEKGYIENDETIFNSDWKIEVKENIKKLHDQGILVPINDFSGKYIFDEKEYQLHLLNAKEKEKKLKEIGYKPKIKQWKEWQKSFESKLYENPNYITYKDKKIMYNSYEDIIVFSYYRNSNTNEYDFFFIENDGLETTHGDLNSITPPNYECYDSYCRGKYSGRLFPHEKIISFWNFPENQEKMKEIAEDILEYTGIDVYKEKYVVEILKIDTIINDTNWGEWEFPEKDEIDFIPVEKYYGSMKRKEEELNIPHIMSPKEKEKLLKDKGFKPKIKQWKDWQKPFENKNNENDNTI